MSPKKGRCFRVIRCSKSENEEMYTVHGTVYMGEGIF